MTYSPEHAPVPEADVGNPDDGGSGAVGTGGQGGLLTTLQPPSATALPPTPAAVAEYFRRRRSAIAEFSPDNILHNERLWVVETCGLPESELDPAPIITREHAARLDDPFTDKRKFGPRGQYTKCAGCGAVFESLGLRLCAGCSKSSHAPRTKRCQECGAPLSPHSRKTLMFCSAACKQKPIAEVALLRIVRGVRSPDVFRVQTPQLA